MRNLALRILRLLWPPFIVACYLLGAAYVSGCVPLSPTLGGGQSSASLGPDGGAVTESASTLPERMEAAANEVWGWYTALKTKVNPAIEPMRKLYVAGQELVVAVQGKEWLKALGWATTAWALVDEIKGMVK